MASLKTALKAVPRVFVLSLAAIGMIAALYSLWTPGTEIHTGIHDRHTNGIWLQHGWLASNKWFEREQNA